MARISAKQLPRAVEPTVERKIYVYDVDAGFAGDEPVVFDPVPVLKHLEDQPYTLEGRYLDMGEGNVAFAITKSLEYPQKLIYVLSRRNNLPELERNGTMSPLPIPIDSGLGEKIHVVFFGRYAAADFNFYGPRAGSLATYFALKAKGIGPKIRMQQLIKGEAVEDLKHIDGITLAHFKFHQSAMRLVERADESLAAAFRATIEASDADELELILRRKRKGGVTRYLSGHVLKAIKDLAKHQETYEEFDRLVTVGVSKITAEKEEVDVLSDQLILRRKMVKMNKRSRAVQSESAFAEIESAFTEVRPRLGSAGTIV
jgi:hypothetical protein